MILKQCYMVELCVRRFLEGRGGGTIKHSWPAYARRTIDSNFVLLFRRKNRRHSCTMSLDSIDRFRARYAQNRMPWPKQRILFIYLFLFLIENWCLIVLFSQSVRDAQSSKSRNTTNEPANNISSKRKK